MKKLLDHVEVCLRITVSAFCGYALAVGAPSSIVPTTTSFLIGIVAASAAIGVPTLMFGIGAGYPTILVALLFALGANSMLQCGATVSDGLFVALFAIYCVWISGLKYGKDKDKTAGMANLCIILAAMNALSFRTLVQDGLSVTIDVPPTESESVFFEFVRRALSALCVRQGNPEDCWMDALPEIDTSIEVTIPDGDFEGQTATIRPDNGSVTIEVEGGLWIVAGLWKWQGLDNALAGNGNFLIAFCWGLACVAIGILLPPFRTARSALSTQLVPAAIFDVKDALTNSLKQVEAGEEGDESDEEPRIGRLSHYANTFAGGGVAALTAFEPRLLTAPFECTWTILKDLVFTVNGLLIATVALDEGLQKKTLDKSIQRDTDVEALKEASHRLESCANAMATVADPKDELESLAHQEEAIDRPSKHLGFGTIFLSSTDEMVAKTVAWLNAMIHPMSPLPCTKTGLKNVKGTYLLWIVAPLTFLIKLVKLLFLPLRPSLWNLRGLLESVKWSTGYVVLFIMSVYWERFHDFAIDTGAPGVGGLYSGWHIVAYGLCWNPTYEGTVKIGIQRVFGTALGGFMAWLAIIACSGSYDDDDEVNEYALVAWLTVTTYIVAHFAVEKGVAARLGQGKDRGAAAMYTVMTQALCALEVQAGSGTKGDIVSNRVIATSTGVLMAIVFAAIPPHTSGGDPKFVHGLLLEAKQAMSKIVSLLSNLNAETVQEEIEEQRSAFRDIHGEKYREASFLLKDANKLKILPFCRVDPQLPVLLEEITVTSAILYSTLHLLASEITVEEFQSAFAPGTIHRAKIDEMLSGNDGDEMEKGEDPESASDNVDFCVALLLFVQSRVDKHEETLHEIMNPSVSTKTTS